MTMESCWVAFGLIGQLLFTARFLVQWLSSERQGRSVIPVAFWYLSIGGAAILLTYAIYRRDPVFILGQSTGMSIYLRNLQMIRRQKLRDVLSHSQAVSDETSSAVPAPQIVKLAPVHSSPAASESPVRRAA
jgi:lipid-A-disaccharide synthase-like uncharacterized protein